MENTEKKDSLKTHFHRLSEAGWEMAEKIWWSEIKINFVISSLYMWNTVLLHWGEQYAYVCVCVFVYAVTTSFWLYVSEQDGGKYSHLVKEI